MAETTEIPVGATVKVQVGAHLDSDMDYWRGWYVGRVTAVTRYPAGYPYPSSHERDLITVACRRKGRVFATCHPDCVRPHPKRRA